jgi:hypothetical protein
MILALRYRRAAILTVFIAVAAVICLVWLRFEGRMVAARLQGAVEEKISRSLNATVKVGSVRLGILGPIVLKNFNLTKQTAQDTPFIFKSDKLIIYHNLPRLAMEKLLNKKVQLKKRVVFKIENGFLYKGEAVIFRNISGYGRIVNDNLIFDDLNGRCYNFPLSVYGNISAQSSKVDLNIRTTSHVLRGRFYVSNRIFRPHVVGTIQFNNGRKIYFSGDADIRPGESVSLENVMVQNALLASGKIDFIKKRFIAQASRRGSEGAVKLVMDFSRPDLLQSSFLFDHVSVAEFDLSSQLDIEIALAKTAGAIEGRIGTSGTVLDYRPFKEANGEFSVQDGTFKLAGLKLGEDYNLYGFVDTQAPYNLDLTLDIKESTLSQLLLASEADEAGRVRGNVRGRIRTTGPIYDLITVANLECGKGNIGNLDYESMNVNLKGSGAVLKVADSRILRKEGYIDLSGDVDLKRLWSKDPCKGLDWTCGNQAIVWEGWDIVRQAKSQELKMQKGLGSQKEFMVTFKSYLNDEQSWEDSQGANQNETVGVEYSLDEAKRVKMQLRNNEEVFSLENKVRF